MTDNLFAPPAAEGLPLAALDSATEGADRLDAMAITPYGRNLLAHALVQLARDGWLRPEPGDGFEPVRDRETPEPEEAPADAPPALVDLAAQAIRDSNGTPEALEWWRTHPQLIPAHVYAAAVLAVLPPPADRAAVLAEAIVAVEDPEERAKTTTGLGLGWEAARDVLRRLAAEAQQPAAHEPEHSWAAELYDPVADEWVPGTRYLVRARAVNHLAHARSIGPTWKDGTPVERRLVRATTTYTVEQPAAADTGEEAEA